MSSGAANPEQENQDRRAGKRRRRSRGSQTEMTEDEANEESSHVPSRDCSCHLLLEKIDQMSMKLDIAVKAIAEIESLKEKVSSVEIEKNQLKDSLEFTQAETAKMKLDNTKLSNRVAELDIQVQQMEKKLAEEKSRGVKLESFSRRNNLRFFNIPEMEGESWEDTEHMLRTFIDKNLKGGRNLANDVSFERAHRTGSRSSTSPRAIVAKFSFFKDKEKVRSVARNLKGTNFGISEDYPKEVADVRRKLVPLLKSAREAKQKAYIKYDQLFIDDEVYTGPGSERDYVLSSSDYM